MSKEAKELLRQCADLPKIQLCDDVKEIIKKSKAFPIPFPITTVRLEDLKARKSLDILKRNIVSTYPLIHERVLLLMAYFLIYKREFGSNIEKALYNDMSVPDFIERLLRKRAISFLGKRDKYQLITRETGSEGWEAVGTLQQKPPLILENCLSYDEMKLSAMLYVSGYTCCINDGKRKNSGVVEESGVEEEAVIIGLIGPRFQRRCRMDNEDILITREQNCLSNGYGEDVTTTTCQSGDKPAKYMWRQLWSKFYQVDSYTYEELSSRIALHNKDRYNLNSFIMRPKSDDIFDNEVYYKRICVLAETTLMEAEYRASERGKNAFINVIGCGLGVWKISPHQPDVYVLTFLERIRAFLKKDHLNHVTDVNFAYIKAGKNIKALFTNKKQKENRIFLESKGHPAGGINIYLEDREPSSKLSGEHTGKLLVMTYPWDGNAHPGNEFWLKKLSSSGDPAAACSTQVSELHNAYINPAVNVHNLRVAGRSSIKALAEYCRVLACE